MCRSAWLLESLVLSVSQVMESLHSSSTDSRLYKAALEQPELYAVDFVVCTFKMLVVTQSSNGGAVHKYWEDKAANSKVFSSLSLHPTLSFSPFSAPRFNLEIEEWKALIERKKEEKAHVEFLLDQSQLETLLSEEELKMLRQPLVNWQYREDMERELNQQVRCFGSQDNRIAAQTCMIVDVIACILSLDELYIYHISRCKDQSKMGTFVIFRMQVLMLSYREFLIIQTW